MRTLGVLTLIFYCLFAVFIYLMSVQVKGSPELVLESKVMIQRDYGQGNWKTVEQKSFSGLSGIQYWFDTSVRFRMVIEVEKPYDLESVLRVRMVSRADGKVIKEGEKKAVIIFGPHEGCPSSEERCKPLSLDDVGLVEIRLDTEKAQFTGFGVFTLRPYTERSPIKIRPSVVYRDRDVPCGTDIPKKGFLFFVPKLVGNGSVIDAISLCLTNPKGKVKCADDGEAEVRKLVTKKGLYQIVLFDERQRKTTCNIRAV
jgi:hypothetical protein